MKTEFPKLARGATKEEEVAWLNAAAAAVSEGTYLYELFSGELLAWAAERIRSDFPVDVFCDKVDAEKEASSLKGQLDREIAAHNAACLRWEDDVARGQAQIVDARAELTAAQLEVVQLKAKLYDLLFNERDD